MLEINSTSLLQCDAANDNYYRQQARFAAGGGLVQHTQQDLDVEFNSRFFGTGGGGLINQRSIQPDARSLSCVVEAARQQTRPLQIITEEMLRRSFEQAVFLHSNANNSTR